MIAVRPAGPDDAEAIRAVHVAAFGRAAEADLVAALPPVISLVDEEVRGHVLLSEAFVGDHAVLALGPLGVLPAAQGQGLGRALVREAVARARETAYPLIVVLGHPAFYGKLGFEPARRLGVRAPFKLEDVAAWRALRLPRWSEDVRGTMRYPDACSRV